MFLPDYLRDDVVPEQVAVVGDIEAFIAHLESGEAWEGWIRAVQESARGIEIEFGPISEDVLRELLREPPPE